MAKRRSEEARVLAYFTQAPLEKAELMLGLVKDQVKQRGAISGFPPTEQVKAKRRKKVKAAGTSAQTSFSPETMGTAQ